MFGLVEWWEKGATSGARELRVHGVRFLGVSVVRGEGLCAAWSQRRAAGILRRNGVTQAVFPQDFPDHAAFAAHGIAPVEVRPLREALAADIVYCAMAQAGLAPEETTVALCAARATRAYAAAAEELARRVRYVKLCTAHGGWELADALRRALGVAAPVERSAEGADVLLCFDDSMEPSTVRGVYLPLYDRALSVEYAVQTADEKSGGEPEQLLAAWFASLALRAEDVTVTGVSLNSSADSGRLIAPFLQAPRQQSR